ncbi:MAG: transglutaminase-like domain-containing protein [Elusimicrobiota bacterium]
MRSHYSTLAIIVFAALPASAAEAWYADPKLALVAGPQSELDPRQIAAISKEAGLTGKDGLSDAMRIHLWLEDGFESSSAGGSQLGKTTARSILRTRRLTGCHDWALMLSTLLRSAGYPALMVDTAGVQWMNLARAGRPFDDYDGHVFVEAYIGGRWMLFDSVSGRYIPDYDRRDPFIPMEVGNQQSYIVMFKGIDPKSYGVHGAQELNATMLRFAKKTDPAKMRAPKYRILELPGGTPLPPLTDEALTGPCPLDASRRGAVLQFSKAGLDVHVEKSSGLYLAHRYPYGRVFSVPVLETGSFSTLAELKRSLRSIEPAP